MSRRFEQLKIEELSTLVEGNRLNRSSLRDIAEELTHRGGKRVERLRETVHRLLANRATGAEAKGNAQTPNPPGGAKEGSSGKAPEEKTRSRRESGPGRDEFDFGPDKGAKTGGGAQAGSSPIGGKGKQSGSGSKTRGNGGTSHTQPKDTSETTKRSRNTPDANMPFSEASDILENFEQALEIEIVAVKNQNAQQAVELRNGKRIDATPEGSIYIFLVDEDIRIPEDSPIVVVAGGREGHGTLLSILEGKVTISVDEDFGDYLAFAQLRTDSTYLLKRLAERLKEIRVAPGDQAGFHRAMMDRVLDGDPSRCMSLDPGVTLPSTMNENQKTAVWQAFGSDVTYVWGPPGTGKSVTLAHIVRAHYRTQRKVLLVSNTNRAVDGLLRNLCELLEEDKDPGFDQGSVLRHGPIVDTDLQKYADRVSIDDVVARLGEELEKKRVLLEGQLAYFRNQARPHQEALQRFLSKEELESQLGPAERALNDATSKMRGLQQKLANLDLDIAAKESLLVQAEKTGAIKRLFTGLDPDKIRKELAQLKEQKGSLPEGLAKARTVESSAKDRRDELARRHSAVSALLVGKTRQGVEAALRPLEEKIDALSEKLQEVRSQLGKIREEVLSRCLVLAATATQTFLKPKEFPGFPVVIIDEGSMVPLPAIAYAAGLAKDSVVVAGDFRQLPSIIISEHEAVVKFIGRDIFAKAGIVDAVESKQSPPALVKLNIQYRMAPEICELVNGPFYGGTLCSGPGAGSKSYAAHDYPAVLRHTLTLVDTGSQNPFVNTKPRTWSRYNILHAVAIRNLLLHLKEQGFLSTDVGVISPYSAQAKILHRLSEELQWEGVSAGTVHRFQGAEKDVIVLDIADSIGLYRPSQFIRSCTLKETGAKLQNVALSRPRSRLVCFANVGYLERSLPPDSYVRQTISRFRSNGKVMDVSELLDMDPDGVQTVWSMTNRSFDLGKDTRFFDQDSFTAAVTADVERARHSVVIFSGFSTIQRVAAWSDLLRAKIQQQVKVRCVTRDPANQGSISEDHVREALAGLLKIGVALDLRRTIHQKVVMIDGETLWYGSLNPLSHNGGADETMLRVSSRETCLAFADNQIYRRKSIGGVTEAEKEQTIFDVFATAENPVCPNCGSMTVFFTISKNGPYFKCAKRCDWSCSLDRVDSNARASSWTDADLPEGISRDSTKPCPECGGTLGIKSGRWGFFWACRGYPNCRCTEPLSKKSGGGGSRSSKGSSSYSTV